MTFADTFIYLSHLHIQKAYQRGTTQRAQTIKHRQTHKHTLQLQSHNQAQPSTESVWSILDQWVQSTDRRQSKPDIKEPISNSRERIHKNSLQKAHTHTVSTTLSMLAEFCL